MPWQTWFVFDLGNVVIKLNYERVIHTICRDADVDRDALIRVLEGAGGYRDLEKGLITFREFHEFLGERAGYRGDLSELTRVWSDFFDGPMDGIETVLERVRRRYRVAFLSNSNEVHADLIPKQFASLFEKDDRLVFSHRYKCAKPDPVLYQRCLEILGAMPSQVIYTDDLVENVIAARELGIRSFHFVDSFKLLQDLEREGLIEKTAET